MMKNIIFIISLGVAFIFRSEIIIAQNAPDIISIQFDYIDPPGIGNTTFIDDFTIRAKVFYDNNTLNIGGAKIFANFYLNGSIVFTDFNQIANPDDCSGEIIVPPVSGPDCGNGENHNPVFIHLICGEDPNVLQIEAWSVNGTQSSSHVFSEPWEIQHPCPAVEEVSFLDWEPEELIIGNNITNENIFNDDIKFRVSVDYNDSLSHQEKINVKVLRSVNGGPYNQQGDIIEGFTPENDTTNIIVDNNGQKIIVSLGENGFDFGLNDIYLEAWFDEYDTPHKESEHLRIDHPKPVVDSVRFEGIEPNLVVGNQSANRNVFNDTISFRAKAYYNDSLSYHEKVFAQAFRFYNGIETEYTPKFELTQTNEKQIIIPKEADPKFIVPLNYDFGEHQIYIKAWFELDGIPQIDIVTSPIIYLNHPKPIVDSVRFEGIEPNLVVGNQSANRNVFNDTISFRAKAYYNDSLSYHEKVFAQAFRFYNGIETEYSPKFELTQTNEKLIIVPKEADPKFIVSLNYDFGEHHIYIKAWFELDGIPQIDIVTSPIIYLNHPKPIVDSVRFEGLEPNLVVGNQLANRNVFNDTISFRAKAYYNDSLSYHEKVFAQAFRLYNGIETEYTPKFELTQTNEKQIIVPKEADPKFIVPLNYDFGEHQIYIKTWFELDGIPQIDVITSHILYLYHPKPKVTSIEYINLNPIQLENYFNQEKEIYNDALKFKIKVNYNDTLSVNETVKIRLTYIKNDTETVYYYQETETQLNNDSIDFPVQYQFPLNTGDFNTHHFRIDAWFDEPYIIVEEQDTARSAAILLRWRENKAPVMQIITLYDTICPNPNNILIKGEVYDETGIVDSVWIDVNGVKTGFQIAASQIAPRFPFSRTINLSPPINWIRAWAKDTVPFAYEKEIISAKDSIRLIYLHFDPDLQTTYCPKDTNYILKAYPPGGEFSGDGIVYKTGVFNPTYVASNAPIIKYKLTTTTNTAEIQANFSILDIKLEGETKVCHNQIRIYHLDSDMPITDWEIKGGVVNQFFYGTDSLEIRWLERGNYGYVDAKMNSGNSSTNSCDLEIKKMVAVNFDKSPDRYQIVRRENVIFVEDAGDYYYQWLKSENNFGNITQTNYIYDSQIGIDNRYEADVSLYPDCRCAQRSHYLVFPNTFCNGCDPELIAFTSLDLNNLRKKEFNVSSDSMITQINILNTQQQNVKDFILKVIKKDGLGRTVANLKMQLNALNSIPDTYSIQFINLPAGQYEIQVTLLN